MVQGCGVLRSPPALDTYELTTPRVADQARRGRTQILIAEPDALKALDGQNIVIKPATGVIQYLKGAQWADRLPAIVQARLAEAFQRSGRFAGVGKPGEGLAIDYQVVTEIRAFEIRVGNGGQAHIEIFAELLNDRNGTVRATKSFEASAPVSGTKNDDYVAGLDRAFSTVSSEMVVWAAGAI